MIASKRRAVGPVGTTYLFDLIADIGAERLDIGTGPLGRRVVDRAGPGRFEGPRLRGEVVSGSGDWALYRTDGVMVIDARTVLRTDDGALIMMTYHGKVSYPPELRPRMADVEHRHEIDPAEYYIRTTPVFETGAESYLWLNRIVAIGYGYLVEGGGIGYQISAVA